MKLAILLTATSAEGLPRTCHDIFLKEAEKCKLAENGFYDIKPRHWLPKRKVEEWNIILRFFNEKNFVPNQVHIRHATRLDSCSKPIQRRRGL